MTEIEHTEHVKETWERVSPAWERHRDHVFAQTRPVSEWLVDHVEPRTGDTLLELAQTLERLLDAHADAEPNPGRRTFQRLNRVEYENSIRDLLGLDVNIYGLQGLTIVQVVTFFPVAFLLFEGLLRSLDASLEEAALNMGASRWHIFRTVTLPLMVPGFAGAGLLIFIESLADLGNPIIIGGDFNVLASQAWVAIIGQSNFPLGAALSTVLLVPSSTTFTMQSFGRAPLTVPWSRVRKATVPPSASPTAGCSSSR